MKHKSIKRIAISSAACLALTFIGHAADAFTIHVYPAPKAAVAPVIDGKPDDLAWKDAPVVAGFTFYGKDVLAEVQTSFRVLWDDTFLYFAVHCDEPQMGAVNPTVFPRDSHSVFSEEAIELFIDPDHSHDRYYQIAMNAGGSIYDGRREEIYWDSATVVKTYRDKDFWSLEIAVPWGSLAAKPKAGSVIGFNVCRDRLVEKSWTAWARTMTGFHDPSRFAHIVLSGTPEKIGRLSAEFRKGERSGPIVAYGAEGFSKSTYHELASAAFSDIQKLSAELKAIQAVEKDVALAADLSGRIADFEKKAVELKTRSDATRDAAQWVRFSIDMQKTIAAMKKSVGEVKLNALFRGI